MAIEKFDLLILCMLDFPSYPILTHSMIRPTHESKKKKCLTLKYIYLIINIIKIMYDTIVKLKIHKKNNVSLQKHSRYLSIKMV